VWAQIVGVGFAQPRFRIAPVGCTLGASFEEWAPGPIGAGAQMKLARYILFFVLPLILLPSVAQSQESYLARDPVFRSARKAQQEGRIADAEKILNDRVHAIEQT